MTTMAWQAEEIAKLDPKRRALLERLMAEEDRKAPRAAIPPRPDPGAPAPASPAQERLWFLDQLVPGNPAYNMPAAFRLRGELAPAALRRALAGIVRRHEALRTAFVAVEGTPFQRVAPELAPPLPVIDLSSLEAAAREAEAAGLAAAEARAPFDLAARPLVRASLLRLGPGEHVFLLTVHHIVADGWSMGVLFRELEALYGEAAPGRGPAALPELPVQFADFAVWQRQRLEGARHEETVAYWKGRLAGAPPVLDLPADRPRPPVPTYRGGTLSLAFPAGLADELRQRGRRQGATLFMTLLAAFATLLGRWSGSEDVVIGTPVAGRDRRELEPLIGLFLSMLPLRVDLSGDPGFDELLARVRAATLDDFSHGEIPFERLLEELGVERNLSHSPLFQTLFVLQNAPTAPPRLSGLEVEPVAVGNDSAKLDLQLGLEEKGETEMLGWLEYSADLFERATVRRMAGHLTALLAGLVRSAGRSVWEIPLLAAAEERELLSAWNDTARPYRLDLGLHQRIELQAAKTPEAVAVVFAGETLTFRELDARAERLARRLEDLGVGVDDRVAVCAERSLEMVVALLAILKAGGAYVPLDPEYPRDRLDFMLEDCGARVLLTQERLRGRVAAEMPVLALDAPGPGSEAESPRPRARAFSPEQAAYLIYTSGSTGRPKGAVVSHRGIVNRLLWMQEAYGLTAGDRVLQKTPFSFDVSVWEFFWPLLTGARLVVARPGGHRDGGYLVETIARAGITTIHFVPSMLQAFLEEPDLSRCRSLRRVICSGEALPRSLENRFFERLDAGLHNLYGPTEASVDVTFWACDRESPRPSVPIGRPIANIRIHLLDRHLGLVPVGVPGELHIGGVGLGRGYAGRPDLTAERFVPDPFSGDGGRLYKTGDLCRRSSDGVIEYLGRLDHQVKVRGFRIELGEIEAALGRLPGVREAVVAARHDGSGGARLAAYVVPGTDVPPPGAEELRTALGRALPEHMVPPAFVFLEALPLTPNGKVDRKALPEPGRPEPGSAFVAPRTHAEEILAAVWSRVLGFEPIGIHDSFFALGGDSIRSLRVLSLARERGLELSLQQLFQHPTIAELALRASGAGGRPAIRTEPLELLSEADRRQLPAGVEDAYPLTQLQAGMLFHSQLASGTAVYHDVYSLHLRAPFVEEALREALDRLAARHPALRTSFDLARFSEPLQLVHAGARIPLAVEDLSGLSAEVQEKAIAAWIEEEKGREFDAGEAPLLRYAVHVRGGGEFQLTLSFHHAVLDGWSVASLTTELLRLYADLTGGGAPASEPPPAASWRDAVALEIESLRSTEAEAFWLDRLRGSGRTVLPRWPRPAGAPGPRRVLPREVEVPAEVAAGLAALARRLAVPVKSVLLAAHARALGRLCGQPEVLTGLVSNGRPEEADGDRVLGLFLNVVPFRLPLAGGTWEELARAAFDAERELLPFRRFPLARLQRALGGEALLETSFNFVHFHVYEGVRSLSAVEVVDVHFDEETNFPLVANFSVGGTKDLSVRLVLAYDPDQLGEEQIRSIAGCYARCLEAMATAPEGRYDSAPLLTAEEAEALGRFNDTARAWDLERPLHAWIGEQAGRSPDAVAVRAEGVDLTYRELARRARELAGHLRRLGVERGSRVAICAERSPEMVVGLLGILAAGAAYVPIDPSYPAERLASMLEDCRAVALLTEERLAARLPAPGAPVVRLDADGPEIAAAGEAGPVDVAPEDLAYVIYTSGSTGRPKGAMVPHRGIVNRLLWMQDAYGLTAGDRVLQKTPFSFDVSVWEFFWPLMVGARLVMARPEGHKDPSYLIETIAREGITTIHFVPSMLRAFLDDPEVERCRSLRRVVCSGEALPPALVERFFARLPGVELHNLYGPTEASVDVTAWPCAAGDRTVPIGRPIANLRIHVLDEHLLPAPVGSPGELHIAGAGLGRGYLGRPELTAEKFIPDPSGEAGSRMYKTGDLARWLPNGSLDYLGRIDFQVKVRGFRIELGEIEAVLGRHPAVAECVVVARRDGEDHRLVAYFAARGGEAGTGELRAFLAARLPDFMVPALFVRLDALPLSPNGKVDRRLLPDPGEAPRERDRPYAPPETPLEKTLAEIWSQALGASQVGLDDDFFALGGDSILSIRVLALARQKGIRLSLEQLFEHKTIRKLVAVIPGVDLDPSELLARLDHLSDEEVDALLSGVLGRDQLER